MSDRALPKVLIVIVNYRSSNLVESLINQIEKQTTSHQFTVTVVCVDNSECQREVTALRQIQDELATDLILLVNDRNVGYGPAINMAANHQGFDYICCINPDVQLNDHALENLVNHAREHGNQGLWGIVTVDSNNRADFRHAWPEPTVINTLAWSIGLSRVCRHPALQDNYAFLGTSTDEDTSVAYNADSVSGCCMMISSLAWHRLNGFDPDFFLYSEEIDLCRRARLIGFQPTVVPASRLQHKRHSYDETTNRLRIVYRGKLLYMRKHYGRVYNLMYRLSVCLGALVRVPHALLRGRIKRANAWFTVLVDCLSYESKINADRAHSGL